MARYYPRGSRVPGSAGYDPDPVQDYDENGWAEWLYGAEEGNWTQADQERFDRLYALEPFKTYFDYLLDARIREKIFALTGTRYSDVTDPRNVYGAGDSGRLISTGVNFVSDNVRFLYKRF